MNEIKLKRCPFCGGKAFVRQNKDAMKTYSAYCGNEDCSASPKVSAYGKEMAIQLWNTRKPMERILERLETMKLIRIEQCDDYYEDEVSTNNNFMDAIKIVREEMEVE